jgi:hypothetical protein
MLKGVVVKEIRRVQPLDGRQPDKSRTCFYRDHTVTNWMLEDPWVLPSGQSESERMSYEFSDARPAFRQIAWELSRKQTGENLGYACFQLSRVRGRQTLKVLDHDLADSTLLLPLALKMASEQKIALIEGSASLEELRDKPGLPRFLVHRRQRITQVHPRAADSPMGRAWQQLEPSYTDGDMAFT